MPLPPMARLRARVIASSSRPRAAATQRTYPAGMDGVRESPEASLLDEFHAPDGDAKVDAEVMTVESGS